MEFSIIKRFLSHTQRAAKRRRRGWQSSVGYELAFFYYTFNLLKKISVCCLAQREKSSSLEEWREESLNFLVFFIIYTNNWQLWMEFFHCFLRSNQAEEWERCWLMLSSPGWYTKNAQKEFSISRLFNGGKFFIIKTLPPLLCGVKSRPFSPHDSSSEELEKINFPESTDNSTFPHYTLFTLFN